MGINFNESNIVHHSVSENKKEFIIRVGDGNRDYSNKGPYAKDISDNDQLYTITCDRGYPYTSIDIAKMIYYLLINKRIPQARRNELKKIIKGIKDAFEYCKEDLPQMDIPVCKFTNCTACPYLKDGHCTTDGAWLYILLNNKE
jgi:hypothetical protein